MCSSKELRERTFTVWKMTRLDQFVGIDISVDGTTIYWRSTFLMMKLRHHRLLTARFACFSFVASSASIACWLAVCRTS